MCKVSPLLSKTHPKDLGKTEIKDIMAFSFAHSKSLTPRVTTMKHIVLQYMLSKGAADIYSRHTLYVDL